MNPRHPNFAFFSITALLFFCFSNATGFQHGTCPTENSSADCDHSTNPNFWTRTTRQTPTSSGIKREANQEARVRDTIQRFERTIHNRDVTRLERVDIGRTEQRHARETRQYRRQFSPRMDQKRDTRIQHRDTIRLDGLDPESWGPREMEIREFERRVSRNTDQSNTRRQSTIRATERLNSEKISSHKKVSRSTERYGNRVTPTENSLNTLSSENSFRGTQAERQNGMSHGRVIRTNERREDLRISNERRSSFKRESGSKISQPPSKGEFFRNAVRNEIKGSPERRMIRVEKNGESNRSLNSQRRIVLRSNERRESIRVSNKRESSFERDLGSKPTQGSSEREFSRNTVGREPKDSPERRMIRVEKNIANDRSSYSQRKNFNSNERRELERISNKRESSFEQELRITPARTSSQREFSRNIVRRERKELPEQRTIQMRNYRNSNSNENISNDSSENRKRNFRSKVSRSTERRESWREATRDHSGRVVRQERYADTQLKVPTTFERRQSRRVLGRSASFPTMSLKRDEQGNFTRSERTSITEYIDKQDNVHRITSNSTPLKIRDTEAQIIRSPDYQRRTSRFTDTRNRRVSNRRLRENNQRSRNEEENRRFLERNTRNSLTRTSAERMVEMLAVRQEERSNNRIIRRTSPSPQNQRRISRSYAVENIRQESVSPEVRSVRSLDTQRRVSRSKIDTNSSTRRTEGSRNPQRRVYLEHQIQRSANRNQDRRESATNRMGRSFFRDNVDTSLFRRTISRSTKEVRSNIRHGAATNRSNKKTTMSSEPQSRISREIKEYAQTLHLPRKSERQIERISVMRRVSRIEGDNKKSNARHSPYTINPIGTRVQVASDSERRVSRSLISENSRQTAGNNIRRMPNVREVNSVGNTDSTTRRNQHGKSVFRFREETDSLIRKITVTHRVNENHRMMKESSSPIDQIRRSMLLISEKRSENEYRKVSSGNLRVRNVDENNNILSGGPSNKIHPADYEGNYTWIDTLTTALGAFIIVKTIMKSSSSKKYGLSFLPNATKLKVF